MDPAGNPAVTGATPKRVTTPGGRFLVRQLLDGHPQETYTGKQIARLLGLKRGAVRVFLSRLSTEGKIRRVAYGVYQSGASLVRPELPDPRLRIHGLKVEACYTQKGGPFRQVLQRVLAVWPSPELHRHPLNHSITTRAEWLGRSLTITVHPEASGLLEVFMQASDRPMSFMETYAFLTGTIVTGTGIPQELWTVRQVDINIDGKKVDLGIEGLSIAGFGKFVMKVYEKAADTMRAELRSFEETPARHYVSWIEAIYAAYEQVRGL